MANSLHLFTGFNATLQELNADEALVLLPAVIFTAIMIIVGFVGNLHVFIVCRGKYKRNSTFKVFVLYLATVDILACSTAMPFEAVALSLPYMFTLVNVCKILRYINMALSCSSSFLLVTISIERFKRVCYPLKQQITTTKAKYLCSLAILIASSLSILQGFIQGERTVELFNNITGIECTVSDEHKNSTFRAIFGIEAIFVFGVNSSIIVCLYICIARRIRRQNKKRATMIGQSPKYRQNNLEERSPNIKRQSNMNGRKKLKVISWMSKISLNRKLSLPLSTKYTPKDNTEHGARSVECEPYGSSIELKAISKETSRVDTTNLSDLTITPTTIKNNSSGNANRKMTQILFLITICFILSYLPYVAMSLIESNVGDIRYGQYRVVYHIAIRTYYLNSVVNPMIYCFYDKSFRDELKALYTRKGTDWTNNPE